VLKVSVLKKLKTIIVSCVFAYSQARAEPAKDFAALQNALYSQQWDAAKAQATAIDAQFKQGDFMKAYADSFQYAALGQCDKAVQLATPLAQAQIAFLPAHDIIAGCLMREGRKISASHYYQQVAQHLPESPIKQAALERVKTLKPDDRVRFSLDSMITPSTNIVRQTSETDIGSFKINEESRAKSGVSLSVNAFLTKPLFYTDSLTNLVRFKFGGQYNTVTKNTYPVVGIENITEFKMSPKTTASVSGFYEHMWLKQAPHMHSYGTRASLTHRVKPDLTLLVQAQVNWNDFKDNYRDGLQLLKSFSVIKTITGQDRLTGKIHARHSGAKSDVLRYSEIGVSGEWEHAFENGFVPSLGTSVEHRFFQSNAPTKNKKQYETALSATVGLSHRKFNYKNIYPELSVSYTKQFSNNSFRKFNAVDVGLNFKTEF
jgi:hypothetical protein